ncbi:retron Ec67 family RNA-directed DNA polymerase/endonuclease [Polynucleobacter yangtzensis]|uniref:retron Ec67 family RNA-directed DNA polymerase/endonuclease n=1 Tax=Polynucleobacter yangtzensis TaxID=1743159 RepID=UPI00082AADFB|nr:retron Ec67 family RNA-directed DNA polymerase/endonuclease [Polynucleobacter yangtzensis]
MTLLAGLKSARTIQDVARLLNTKASALAFMLYKESPDTLYTEFSIPKKYGGFRAIAAPIPKLKLVQRKLADILQICLQEINEKENYSDKVAHGFKRGRSIVTNAQCHKRKRLVFNLDLEDYFGSINFGRVRGFFMADRNFQLHPSTATILAQIACYKNSLPQGSPCSPIISNLVGNILDVRLVRLAKESGLTYTRYADDLTFSTNAQSFPESIAVSSADSLHSWMVGKGLNELIERSGFRVNSSKVRVQYRHSRQEVTGLVVNKRVNIPSTYRRKVRAMVYSLVTEGYFEFKEIGEKDAESAQPTKKGSLNQLHGMLSYIYQLDSSNRKELSAANFKDGVPVSERDVPLTTTEKVFRRFLFFKNFYSTQKPVIICEGKTDNIYLHYALLSLATRFPNLVVKQAQKYSFAFSLHRYSRSSTERILGIQGGSGDLKMFMLNYLTSYNFFKVKVKKQPVILLIDNDDGANDIFSMAKNYLGYKPTGQEPFLHVDGNLYLMPTPLLNSRTKSTIEDFFDDKVKSVQVSGRSFDPKRKHNGSASTYGKNEFAREVVAKQANSIDFSKFSYVFKNIEDIIADFQSKVAAGKIKP